MRCFPQDYRHVVLGARDGRVSLDLAAPGIPVTARVAGTVSDDQIALSRSEHVSQPDLGEDDRTCRARLKRK